MRSRREGPRRGWALALAAGLLALSTPFANAEHEADHRYVVKGYVLDASRQPLRNDQVSIAHGDQLVGSGMTDRDGFYRIQLHLHDSDLGKELQLRTRLGEGSFTVRFEPGDKITPRVHWLNIVAGEALEGELSADGLPTWSYYLLAAALTASLLALGARYWRRRAQQPAVPVKAQAKTKTQARGRRKRR